MIEINQLTKRFGDLVAVDELNLTIPAGEFFAILGPNAAGKTTTIKMITGLIKPTSGTVRIAGFDIHAESIAARQRIAYIPDFPFLYEKLTPHEFMKFTGRLFRLDEKKIMDASEELIGIFNLEPFRDKQIEGLSHGTRQRVALAAAFLHDPEVFIIDEPMVGLDPLHSRIVKDMLKDRAQHGTTVFMSTHQLSVAEEMSDRIGIMHEGRLITIGAPDELRRRSGTGGAFERSFLALTNQEKRLFKK
ncbi:MAG: ABC transporter ATP-binding protein [Verrucomicrobia bacterium]|nr:ABC transporter ATP-binding protein [Verrucomicrobiota bacterium]MCF7708651.1 ABC transporter ATP-binding protein [Verrucomicrobiota bacterium]